MANVIRLKRASGSDPTASDLVSGEPAVRTDTGELFFKKDDGSVAKVSGAGGGPDFKYLALRNAANNGAASFPNADFTLVTSGTTTALTPTAANTLLVSVNGVIQKPNTGTSTPSSGFALSGSTIKFGANLSAAPDFILYQESGGIGEPSDETVSEAKLKVSNSPVNGYFLSAQSGNTGGLTWAAPVATSCTGNSATATALATARTINGTSFDGTANITVTAAAGTLTGTTLNSSVTASSLTSLGDLAGLTVNGDMSLTGANYNVLWDKSDNALEFADNAKAVFGTGGDLQIYHDGSHSYIKDAGTGKLRILTNELLIGNVADDENIAKFIENGAVELYYDNIKRIETTSSGASVGGALSVSNGVRLPDLKSLFLGDNDDFVIVHTGFASYINNNSGDLYIRNDNANDNANILIQARDGENSIYCHDDGAVELYHDNSKKFETASYGCLVTGNLGFTDNDKAVFGIGSDLQIYHDGTENRVASASGINHRITTDQLIVNNAANNEEMFKAIGNGACELYYDAAKKLETTSTGIAVTGAVEPTGHVKLDDDRFIYFGTGDDFIIGHQSGTPQNLFRSTDGATKMVFQGGSETMMVLQPQAQVELYYDNSKKFETTSAGVRVQGQLSVANTASGGVSLSVADNAKAAFGTSDDLQIYHDGSHSYVADSGTGNLYIQSNHVNIDTDHGEQMVNCIKNGAVELYYDNSKKLETASDGVKISGNKLNITDTGSVNLYLTADTDNSDESHVPRLHFVQDGSATRLIIGSEGTGGTAFSNSNGNSPYLMSVGSVPLLVATDSTGRWQFTSSGHFYPMANNSYDIGSSSNRVRDIFTNDLNLSNEGGSNDVDGTWGSYTIQEGEESLFLINKRNGKKYKFNLTEVS